jgi:hypothetical protein
MIGDRPAAELQETIFCIGEQTFDAEGLMARGKAALDVLEPRLNRLPVDLARPCVSIPSYNGARHTPNLVPLLACLLADAGVQVVVEGLGQVRPGQAAALAERRVHHDHVGLVDDVQILE